MMTKLRTLGTAAVLALGMATQALAAPIFSVDPAVLGGPAATFNADRIIGGSSTLITLSPGLPGPADDTASGSGWINFGIFENLGTQIFPFASGLGVNYQLWAEFDYELQLTSGILGNPGSSYIVTDLSFDIYASKIPDGVTTFTQADSAGAGTAATVTPGAGGALAIGGGSLVVGVAELNALGGTGFNSTTTYANTNPLGDSFFFSPDPFYNVAFNNFNNTSQGVVRTGNLIAIQANGSVDFNTIPEPATVALMGLGLLGIGAVSKRRKA